MPPQEPPDGIAVEPAQSDDHIDILRVLDAAMLVTDAETVDGRIAAGDALVARFDRTGAVVGALVATRPAPRELHVDAIAVRRSRRGRGIGSALIEAVVQRAERDHDIALVTAAFDDELGGFYRDIGFDVIPDRGVEDAGRMPGIRRVDGSTE